MRTFTFAIILIGIFYITKCYSPSSYAWVLKNSFKFENEKTGLILGVPRDIRSDEFAHFTPWTQSVVNNGFKRFNELSVYKEDFRSVFPMPIFDWSMPFKPAMWGYIFLSPPHAYSFYWYLSAASFLLGWAWFLKSIKFSTFSSILISLLYFFPGFVQFWWTNNAGVFAYFPLVLLFTRNYILKNNLTNLVWLFYAQITWMFGLFYPPFIIQFSLLGIAIILAYTEINKVQAVFFAIIGLITAALICGLYLKEELLSIATSPLLGVS